MLKPSVTQQLAETPAVGENPTNAAKATNDAENYRKIKTNQQGKHVHPRIAGSGAG